MTVRQVARKVVRPEHGGDAVRPVAQNRGAAGHVFAALAGTLCLRTNRDGDLAGHRRDFGLGLPEWLAGFQRDGARQLFGVGSEQFGKALADRDPIGQWAALPSKRGMARRPHGRVDIGGAGATATPQGFTGGRTGDGDGCTVCGLPLVVDPQASVVLIHT